MRTYIADHRGFTTGEYRATSDDRAVEHAVMHFSQHATTGVIEVWDVASDTLVRAVDLLATLKLTDIVTRVSS